MQKFHKIIRMKRAQKKPKKINEREFILKCKKGLTKTHKKNISCAPIIMTIIYRYRNKINFNSMIEIFKKMLRKERCAVYYFTIGYLYFTKEYGYITNKKILLKKGAVFWRPELNSPQNKKIIFYFTKAVKLDPGDPFIQILFLVVNDFRNVTKANFQKIYLKLCKIDIRFAYSIIKLSLYILSLDEVFMIAKEEKYDKALEKLQNMAIIFSRQLTAEYYILLYLIYKMKNLVEKALLAVKKASKLCPSYPYPHFILALEYLKRNNYKLVSILIYF